MLVDLHAHTSGISKCCRDTACGILKIAKETGIGGIVLTNHYQKSYVEESDINSFTDKYIEEFHLTQKLGEQAGIKVFFGIEVTMVLYPNVHLLVYGVNTDFIKKHPEMFDYTQEELYNEVKKNNGVLVQAHPFRNGSTVLDTAFLDGIEINCHPAHKNSYSGEILDIAKKNGLAVTCGADYHSDTDYRPHCGMYLPESVTDSIELGRYIESVNEMKLCIHEPNTDVIKDINYRK